MLRHAVSCHVIQGCVMLCHAVRMCHAASCFVMLCHAMSCFVIQGHVMRCHAGGVCHAVSCYVNSCQWRPLNSKKSAAVEVQQRITTTARGD